MGIARDVPQLTELDLSGTEIDDAAVEALARHCTELVLLNLMATSVTDRGLRALTSLSNWSV